MRYHSYTAHLFLFVFFVLFLTSPVHGDAPSGLVQPGAELKKAADGFQFTEGPATDAEGNVYFTDIPNQRIHKWTWKDGSVTLYRENTGEANGLIFDARGRMVACEMGNKRITRDDMAGNISVIADAWNDGKQNMPNDLWIDARGGIYFSDFAGPGAGGGGGLQVYYIAPDGKTVTRATHDLTAPNGLIGTPDGTTLYITDPGAGKTFSYGIKPDGALSNRTLFCDQFADGMALDEHGNLYFSGDEAISIFSPDGKKIDEIAMPVRSANLTFAGPHRKTLFITAQTAVYTLEMTVRGAPTPLDMASGAGLVAPGAKILYVGGRNRVWAYAINADGSLSDKSLFCEENTDGMAMDEHLNVYVTADDHVSIYSPEGKLLEKIDMPMGCSNVEFCGKDRKTLFITYRGHIYTLDMAVRGAPTALDLGRQ